jgi:tRNA(Ile)-lysidine synthase
VPLTDPAGALLAVAGEGPLGLAVSGGGDSLALMHLAAEAGLPAEVATVDHGLRPEAAAEAAMVARAAASLGYRHETLAWNGAAARGNIADAARRARYGLLAQWAQRRGLAAVVLAHTQDDVAETFLMRLARGAGVDGLSAMAPRFAAHGVPFLRPWLAIPRQALRAELAARGLSWVEDPTNTDPRHDRARARAALAHLETLGLTAPRLAEVAGHLAQARAALEAATGALLEDCAVPLAGGLALRLDPARLFAAPEELVRRALVALILDLAPAEYAPRGAQVAGLAARLAAGARAAELGGTGFRRTRAGLIAFPTRFDPRSLQVEGPPGPPPDPAPTLGPLGQEGLAQLSDWRATGLPRAALIASPALWQDGRLMAAPLAGRAGAWTVKRSGPARAGNRPLLSH